MPSLLTQHLSLGPQHEYESPVPHLFVPLGQSPIVGLLGLGTHPFGWSGDPLFLGDSLETPCLFFSASVDAEDGLISQIVAKLRTATTARATATLIAADAMRMVFPPNFQMSDCESWTAKHGGERVLLFLNVELLRV